MISASLSGRPRYIAAALLGLGVSAVFAWLAVRGVHWSEAWHAFRTSNGWWLVPALGMFAVAVVLRICRWQYLFQRESRPPFGVTAAAYLAGMALNNVLPARAGDGARIVVLRRRVGMSVAEATATVAVERVWDTLALLLLLFVLAPWFPHVTWLHAAAILAVLLVAALLAFVVVLRIFGSRPIQWALSPLHRLGFMTIDRVTAGAARVVDGFAGVQRARLAATAFVMTLLSWFATAASFWILMFSFDLHPGFLAAMLVLIAVGLGMILPSSPAALGVFEAATLLALAPYGISRSQALPYAIVLHALNSIPFIVAGWVALHDEGRAVARRLRARPADVEPLDDRLTR